MSQLWSHQHEDRLRRAMPLAARMRPTRLDEFAGQSHLLGEGQMLRRLIEADRFTSLIFFGPPGTGKTTLAEVIAGQTARHFERANAAAVGVKDIRLVIDKARNRRMHDDRGTILFLDEVHRFNKAQQDVLLGDVEAGVLTLIGATTENPYFTVNNALVSRSQVFQFEPIDEQAISALIHRAATDPEKGLGAHPVELDDEAVGHWARVCDGDARRALTALETAVFSERNRQSSQVDDSPGGVIRITLPIAEASIQQKAVSYDRDGDAHYDTISAFIKSVRGSDPDAAVYWLAKMLSGGEDPMFIARRLAILASEDIGNADPRGISMAQATYDIVHRIGMPEARITLAQCTTYLASAPKSNAAYAAINSAMDDVKHQRTVPVPRSLRSTDYAASSKLGHGEGYQYAHQSQTGFTDMDYLGVDKRFYEPVDRGYEKHIRQYLDWIDQQRKAPRRQEDPDRADDSRQD